MTSRSQTAMKKATHGSVLCTPAMLQSFAIRPVGLLAHVWAFAKVTSLLVRARQVYDFGSLLLAYFAPSKIASTMLTELTRFLPAISNAVP